MECITKSPTLRNSKHWAGISRLPLRLFPYDHGHHLFLLSNTSKAFHRIRTRIPGIELFNGTLISADVGLVKPDPAIFRLVCEQFGILPSESSFIDDTPINAEAAQYVGMKAYVFNGDVAKLGKWLIEK